MVRRRERTSILLPLPLALATVVLVGVVDAFLPFNPASYNINVKRPHHVPAASAAAGGKLLPLISELSSHPRAAGTSMLLKPTQGARNSVPPSFGPTAAHSSRCSSSSMSRVFGGAQGLLSLDDHDGGGDPGGGRGNRGGNGGGNGSGGDGDESSAGDEGSSDGREPLVLAGVASGLRAALDGLKEAMRNLRVPWTRKVIRRAYVDSNTQWP